MQLKNISGIEPKEHIDLEDRTPGKDQAAEWIQDNVVDKDAWDEYTISQMAEESGWSRQHIRNCVAQYFKPVDEKDSEQTDTTLEHNGSELTIRVPDDVERESYLRGWLAAYTSTR